MNKVNISVGIFTLISLALIIFIIYRTRRDTRDRHETTSTIAPDVTSTSLITN